MLSIRNLHVTVSNHEVLKGLNLEVKPGEIHAIMGPNGSGKSTLSHVLSGKPGYQVDSGEIEFNNENLLEEPAFERALKGIFLAFQYPVEIPGVNNLYFLKEAYNSQRKASNLPEIDAFDFMKLVKAKAKSLQMDEELLKRSVNVGFSGGEKKRNEILQMSILEPKLCILDETDSGLDIDALRIVADGVNHMRSEKRAFIVVTHYQRLLDFIVPDFVHVLSDGKIVKSGDKNLPVELESKGYAWLSDASL